MAELVSIGREKKTIDLFDTKGGKVTVYTSLTVDQEIGLAEQHGKAVEIADQVALMLDTIVGCFVEWNLGENGTPMPCTRETLKKLTQRDMTAIVQACTGRQMLDASGNILPPDEIAKKGRSA